MEGQKILIVEDDADISGLLVKIMEGAGYQVRQAFSGTEALFCMERELPDCVLLDLMLPGMTGEEVLEQIRQEQKKEMPVLILSAKVSVQDKVKLLRLGADDYITKPFKLGVLVSRVNALLRRAKDFSSADTQLESNGMKVLLLQGQAFKNGKLLDLTAAEYKLLCLFMKNPNVVLTKEQILDKLWDCEGNYIDSSTLTVYMRRLRMKIEDNPSEPQMLLTVRRMGYKWNVLG